MDWAEEVEEAAARVSCEDGALIGLVESIRISLGFGAERLPNGLWYNQQCGEQTTQEVRGMCLAGQVTDERVGDVIRWIYTPNEEQSDIQSTITASRDTKGSFTKYNAYKMRHDLVSQAIQVGETDKKLSSIEVLNEPCDDMTPDFIIDDEFGNKHVVEVGTVAVDDPARAQNSFKAKEYKYLEALMKRSFNKSITLTLVIVSPTTVYSTSHLPMTVVSDLLIRMKLGLLLEMRTKGHHIDFKFGEDLMQQDVVKDSIRSTIESLNTFAYNGRPDAVFITKDFRDNCISPFTAADKRTAERQFKESLDRAFLEKKNPPNHEEKINSFIKKSKKEENTTFHMKPVCTVPMVSPLVLKKDGTDRMPANTHSSTLPDHLSVLWKSAFKTMKKIADGDSKLALEQLQSESLMEDESIRSRLEKSRQEKMKTRGRVDMSEALKDPVIKATLQRDGMFSKKVKNAAFMKERHLAQKRTFQLNTNTDDIAKWLKNRSFLCDTPGGELPESFKITKSLLERSNKMIGNTEEGLDCVEKWAKTSMGRSQLFLSDLAAELTLSLKQFCKGSEFIVKRLEHFNVFVLIKTTNQESHIFYSLYVLGNEVPNVDLPFRKMYKDKSGFFTDFVSIKKSKITNMLIAFPRLITLASFWGNFYGLRNSTPLEFYEHQEASRMLNFTILLSLENKAQTEEIITQTRYMYMEIFKSKVSVSPPDPFKILSKLPCNPRSRMGVFCINKVLEAFTVMVNDPPVREKIRSRDIPETGADSSPGDQWKNLKNFVTGGAINSATSVVNLFYMGYLKDKNEDGEKNSEWALVEKIVEEELKYDPLTRVSAYGGLISASPKPGKSFSTSAMKHGTEMMKKRLYDMFGPNWQKVVTDDILTALSKQTTESLASLKASARIEHKDTKRPTIQEDTEKTVRVKVMEAVAAKLDKLTENPILKLKDFVELVERTSGGVICDLFKKAQHGGLREIYVLTLESRVLQLYVETIARTLCGYFEEETLTHPKNKLRLLDSHKNRSAVLARKLTTQYTDFCNSSDKTRWNQNLLMTGMSHCLFSLTEDFFHGSISRVLNLWSNKLIKMPPAVLKMLSRSTQLTSESYKKLRTQYNTGKATPGNLFILQGKHSPYLKLTTGMMQGILHYTSSLMHISFLCSSKALILSSLKKAYQKDNFRFMMTSVCSSDDSSSILTFMGRPGCNEIGKREAKAVHDCHSLLLAMSYYCEFFSMVESTKSTNGMFDYVEFNSEFIFKNTIAVPSIKSVAACLNITESESFMRKFHEQYNLLAALEATGFPHYNTHLCQLAQGILHYHSMGSGTSMLYSWWASKLEELPDPVHGFFLLDTDLAPGVMGYGFLQWNSLRVEPSLAVCYPGKCNGEVVMAGDGIATKSLRIKFGDNKRWNKLVTRVLHKTLNPPEDPRERIPGLKLILPMVKIKSVLAKIEENPECLFRHANTPEEAHSKLLCRSMANGVAEALGKGNPTFNCYSASAYILFSHCFTKTSYIKSGGLLPGKTTKKTSLMRSLVDCIEQSKGERFRAFSDEEINSIFPLVERYMEATAMVNLYREALEIETPVLRQKKSVVTIQASRTTLPVSLRQVCHSKWFGHSLLISGGTLHRCWRTLVEIYPWLRDTWEETLAESPFDSFLDLYHFISGQTSEHRRLHRVGPAVGTGSFSFQLKDVIRMGYRKNIILSLVHGVQVPRAIKRDDIMSGVYLSLCLPHEGDRKTFTMEYLNNLLASMGDDPGDTSVMKPDLYAAWLMASWHNNKLDAGQLCDHLKSTRWGFRVIFLQPQRKEISPEGEVKWRGDGEVLCSMGNLNLKITLRNDTIHSIVTNKVEELRKEPRLLAEVFKRLSSVPRRMTTTTPGVMCKFNGHAFVHPGLSGCPIYEDQTIPSVLNDPNDLKIVVSDRTVELRSIHTLKRGDRDPQEREFPILRIRARPDRIDVRSDNREIKQKVTDAWVTSSQLSWSAARDLLVMATSSDTTFPTKEKKERAEAYLPWIKVTLKKRLELKGLLTAQAVTGSTLYYEDRDDECLNPLAPESDQEGDSDLDDELDWLEDGLCNYLEEKKEDAFSIWDKCLVDDVPNLDDRFLQGVVGLDDLSPDEMPTWTTILSAVTNLFSDEDFDASLFPLTNTESYMMRHPMWDDLINEARSRAPNFFINTMNGIEESGQAVLSNLMMKVLGIKKREVIRDIGVDDRDEFPDLF